ncbi:ABC transporter substrate-binding protein [Pseudohoeflea coraliihabitans]|uniref:Sugar ABC transporter substrate-binding protein n=1 Tax=Pseudohoeflea coraliihabitans TaxID=2860393 RepID=A0ABS6WML3_9HYPH|nr:sugar ABC transporter substrate-binding protein [Pseudohoeflea sp. DP4N28-3]MBW3097207.1 sugar ABC transporter substrate-binding protein [Pseudohoeflea sp. DP4N28-3]
MKCRQGGFWLSLIVSASIVCLAPGTAGAQEETTLKFWTFLDPNKNGPRESAWAQIIKTFEDEHPGIKIQPEIFPWNEISSKLIVSVSAGRGPDVTLVETNLRQTLARGNILAPLDEYIETWDAGALDDFYHPQERVYDGKTYALNMWSNGSALFYRKDLFDEAGLEPPRSMDEFTTAAKALTVDTDGDGKIDQWGFAEGIARSQPFAHRFLFPLIWASGETIIGPDGKATFNSPAGVKAVQSFVDLVKVHEAMPPDVVNLTYDERLQGFMAGKYAMAIEGMHRYERTQTSPVIEGKVGLVPIPGWSVDKPAPTPVTGWDIGIGATSENKEAAWEFLSHALSYESQLLNAEVAGQVPARKSVAEDAFFESEEGENLKFILDYIATASSEFPQATNLDLLIELFNLAIQEAILRDVSVQQALDNAASKYNRSL